MVGYGAESHILKLERKENTKIMILKKKNNPLIH